MKKLAVALCLVACLGMVIPAYALPSCPHTNSAGVTSKNFGNCVLNFVAKVVSFGVWAKDYFCNASPAVIAVCEAIKPIAQAVGAEKILKIIESIITVGCSDQASISELITFINTFNAGQLQASKMTLKGAPVVSIIDPTPINDWITKK